MLERFVIWMKQKLCKHKYSKHYSRDSGAYVMRCVKCGKENKK